MIKKIFRFFPISRRFSVDITWNLISFGIIGISGICLNLLIVKFYNPSVLGIFNQIYVIYILLSQLTIAGIHFSILKNVTQYEDNLKEVNTIISSGLYLSFIISLIIIIIIYLSRNLWIGIFRSEGVKIGFIYILPALLFFSLNKIYLAYHNSYRRMKSYAIFQALRMIILLISLIVFNCLILDGNKIVIIFSISEFILFVILFLFSLKYFNFCFSYKVFFWMKKNFFFGIKALLGNLFSDANTRIDVLILGIYTSDKIVGIYSFAAMLAEGLYQLPIVFRTNVNPIITQYWFSRNIDELKNMVVKGKKMFYIFMVPTGMVAIFFYPLVIKLFSLDALLLKGWSVFGILILGIMLSSGYIPFHMILNQTGYPSYQTLLMFLIFLTNLILNIILIPLMGILGAAIATGIAFVSQIFYIRRLVWKTLEIKI